MTTITLAIEWRGHQPGDTIDVDDPTAEWLRRTGATAADPELSNREHARRTGANHETVGAVRKGMESTGEIPQSETRVSGDGRVRPASQPPRPEPEPGPDEDDATDTALEVERPRRTAPVATWRAFATTLGIDPKGLTKAEIIAATMGA